MNVLVTGGSGFIGTHLIAFLLENNKEALITNIDLEESKIQDQRLTSLICDIRSKELFSFFTNKVQFDICIHLAALCKEPGFEWEEYFETNHTGTINTIKLCKRLGIENILFMSTMMVYKADEIRRTEESETAPDTAYGISKLLAEKELKVWQSRKKGRQLKIIRSAVVFGKNENANFTRLHNSLRKGFFPYVGKSNTVKSNIYVLELVNFIHFLIKENTNDELCFNFSFPENSEMRTIVKTFKKVFGFKSLNPVLPYTLLLPVSRIFESMNSLGLKNSIHHRRIQKLYHSTDIYPENGLKLGYKFKYDLESSLRDWKLTDDPNIKS
ncbi:MAG: NAD(P)-dependent oxidoreductase [Cyclobacteriaceae bacterium]|nr:NAD(P)-dependent oxidoreductase [Cyclobacteriaceae bacterium HetDA_MAG_MS6]